MADTSTDLGSQLAAAFNSTPGPAAQAQPSQQSQSSSPVSDDTRQRVQDFMEQYGPAINTTANRMGVDPLIVAAHLGHESNWGKSVIPGTNNLGNIKDFSGSGVAAQDNMTGSVDKYRQYANQLQFADAFSNLIGSRYRGAVGAGADMNKFATALKQGGYAEDPNYVAKLNAAYNTVRQATGMAPQQATNSGANNYYIDSSGITDATPKPVAPRSWGDALEDTGLGLASGAAGLTGMVGTAYGLASGDMDNALRRTSLGVQQWAEQNQSPYLRSQKAKQAADMASHDSIAGKAMSGLIDILGNPALAADFVVEQLPMLVAGGVVGRAAGAGLKAAGAAADVATSGATAATVGSMSAMQGATTAQEAYDKIKALPPDVAAQNPTVQGLMKSDPSLSLDDAIEKVARASALAAGAQSGITSAALNLIPGGTAIARTLAGAAKKEGSKAVGALVGGLGETVKTSADMAQMKMAANQAAGQFNANQDPYEGVGEALAGTPLFGVMGAYGGWHGHGAEATAGKHADVPEPFTPVEPAAPEVKANSPLGNAAGVATTPDAMTQRLQGVEAWLSQPGNINAIRSHADFGPQSVGDLLRAYSVARNPNVDPMQRDSALSGVENFLSTFSNHPNWTFGGNAPQGGPLAAAAGSMVPAVRDAGTAVGSAMAMPDGMTLDGQAREVQELGAPREQLSAPPTMALSAPEVVAAKRSADAEYEQAFSDLLKAEQLGVDQQALQALHVRVQQAAVAQHEADARLAEIQQTIEGNRAIQSAQARNAILDRVLSHPDARTLTDQGLHGALTNELRREGYNNPTPTHDELERIGRFTQARDTFDTPDAVEPAAPNELDFAGKAPQKAVAPSVGRSGAIRKAVANGARVVGDKLLNKHGKVLFKNLTPDEISSGASVRGTEAQAAPEPAAREVEPDQAAAPITADAEPTVPPEASNASQEAPATPEPLTATAQRVEDAAAQTHTAPTEGQARAGNYRKGRVDLHGQRISIETPKGAMRRGVGADGKPWEVQMPAHYGYFLGHEGADGDHVDTFVGPHPEHGEFYVVNQHHPDSSKMDEHKVMLGYRTADEAKADYLNSFSNGFGHRVFGSIDGPHSIADLAKMLPKLKKARVIDSTDDTPAPKLPLNIINQLERLSHLVGASYNDTRARYLGAVKEYGQEKADEILANSIARRMPKSAEGAQPAPVVAEPPKKEKQPIAEERKDLDGFDAGMSPMKRGKAITVLNVQVQNQGRIITRRDLVREKVADGAKVETVNGERRLVSPDGSFLDEQAIKQTGMDYADFLASKRQEAEAQGHQDADMPAEQESIARKSQIERGYDATMEVSASQLKRAFESHSGEPLAWSDAKLAAVKSGRHTDGHPEVAIRDADGSIGINDGRHRIQAASERNDRITIAVPREDAGKIKALLDGVSQNVDQYGQDRDELNRRADEWNTRIDAMTDEQARELGAAMNLAGADKIADPKEMLKAEHPDDLDNGAARLDSAGKEESTEQSPAVHQEAGEPAEPAVVDETASKVDDADAEAQSGRGAEKLQEHDAAAPQDHEAIAQDDAGESEPVDTSAPAANDAETKQARAKVSGSRSAFPPDRIEDYGDKIGGAKKDRMAEYRARMEDAIPEDPERIVLSKHFPEPDYERMMQDGVPESALAAVKALRDAIPSKPRRWGVKAWADSVRMIRELAAKTLSDPEFILGEMRNRSSTLAKFADRIALYQELGYPAFTHLKGVEVEPHHFSMFNGETPPGGVRKWSLEMPSKRTQYFDAREQAIEALKRDLASSSDTTKANETKFDIYRRSGYQSVIIGKKVGPNKFIDLKGGFKTPLEAAEYIDQNHAELSADLERKKAVPNERRPYNNARTGPDRMPLSGGGSDLVKSFADRFGFKGRVEFGNSMPQDERSRNLNKAYDGLMDLAEALNVPPEAISLNGTLGIGFGSRGNGGKNAPSAHFEPGKIAINLTRNNGAGSLAHEWWHAVDNYFSRMRGEDDGYVTAQPERKKVVIENGRRKLVDDDAIRPEVVQAFKRIVDTIKKSGMAERAGILDSRRSKDYWTTIEEMTARSFERYVIDKADRMGVVNDFLANIQSKEGWDVLDALQGNDKSSYPYPTPEEAQEINSAFQHFFNTLKVRSTDSGVALFSRRSADSNDGPSFGVEDATRFLAPIAAKLGGAAKLRVVESFSDLPEKIQKDARDQGADENSTHGVFDQKTGEVYIVANKHNSEAALETTLLHEMRGHAGIKALFGREIVPELNKLFMNLGGIDGLRKIMADRGHGEVFDDYIRGALEARKENPQRWTDDVVRSVLSDEVLAHIAQGRPKLLDRVKAIIGQFRDWLRKKGFAKLSEYGETDLLNLLRRGEDAMRGGGDDGPGSGVTMLSRHEADTSGLRDTELLNKSRAGRLFSSIAKFDDAFQQPTSHAKDIEAITSEIDPGFKVRKWGSEFGEEFNDGTHPEVWELNGPHSDNRPAYIFDDGKNVWVDVQFLHPGVDAGSKIYGIAAAYAHNNGRKLIGDPAGLSPMAFFRRTENMISSALKFGTTDHLEPHEAQINPEAYYKRNGEPAFAEATKDLGIDWKPGDTEHNIREMLHKSHEAAVKFAPEIENIAYDFDKQHFVKLDTGDRFDRSGFDDISKGLRAGEGARYLGGSKTLARAALVNTLVQDKSREGWSRVLAGLGDQLSGRGLDPELKKTLYSVRTNATTPGRITREDALAATDAIRRQTGVTAHVIESPSQAPRELQESIKRSGYSAKSIEGAFHRGEIWLFADNIGSIERAREVLLHEGAHYGLRGMFGDRLDPLLLEIEEKNPKIRDAVDRLLESSPSTMSRVRAAEEVLVEMAAKGEATKLKVWPKLCAVVRNILRQMGFVKSWTPEDIQLLLGRAHEFWKSGRRPMFSQAIGGTVFGLRDDAETATRRMAKMVDAYTSGSLKPQDTMLLGDTPKVMAALGAPDLQLNISGATIQKVLGKADGKHGHAITADMLKQIPEHLHDPLMVFDSDPSIPGHKGGFVILTELKDRLGNPVVSALHVEKQSGRFLVNDIASVYGKEDAASFAKWASNGLLRYYRDEQSLVAASTVRLQLPYVVQQARGFGGKVLTESDIVNSHADAAPNVADSMPKDGEERFSSGTARDVVRDLFDQGGDLLDKANKPFLGKTPNFGKLDPQQQATLEKIGLLKQPETWRQQLERTFEGFGDKFVQNVLDAYHPLKAISDKAYKLARMVAGSDGAFETVLKYGIPVLQDGGYFTVKEDGGFLPRLGKVVGNEAPRFFAWVAGNRAERLAELGKENLFDADDIDAMKRLSDGNLGDEAGGKSRAQAYKEAADLLDEYNRGIMDIAEKAGLIDGESRKIWEHGFYVPFYRNIEDGVSGPSVKSGLVNQKAFKALKGGTRQLNEDLLANVLNNWAHLITASRKNIAAREALRAAESLGVAEQIPTADKGSVMYVEGGAPQHFAVHDEAVMNAITAMESPRDNGLTRAMKQFKYTITRGVTFSPFFKARIMIRDTIQAAATAPLSYNLLNNLREGWAITKPDSEGYAEMLANGALFRTEHLLEGNRADHAQMLIDRYGVKPDQILDTKEKVTDALRKLNEWWQETGERAESVNRAALYKQLIEKGVDPFEAAYQARDVMDFSSKGLHPTVRLITGLVPFMNARLQGMYKLARGAKEDPRRFGYVAGGAVLASLALLAAYHDDPDWKKREDWDRENFWWFKIGDQAYRIPKPFELGAIASVAERTAELMADDKMTGREYLGRMRALAASQLALDPTPYAVKPLIDVYANKDPFFGGAIESEADRKLRPEDRYNNRTSELARFVSTIGLPDPVSLVSGSYDKLSPKQLDYLARAYFGSVATFANAVVDNLVRPALGRPDRPSITLKEVSGGFAEQLPSNASRYVTTVYERVREIEQAHASLNAAIRAGDMERAAQIRRDEADLLSRYKDVEAIKKQVSKLGSEVRNVELSRTMNGDQKLEAINRLRQQQDKVAQALR